MTIVDGKPGSPLGSFPEQNSSRWKVLGASVTGRFHLSLGRENEDALAASSIGGGSVLLALADGAGSAERAGEGAREAVRGALDALEATLRDEDGQAKIGPALEAALGAARSSIARLARASRVKPRQFACTLLLGALLQDQIALLQIGDGAAIIRQGGAWQRAVPPLRGQHAGETVFITGGGMGRRAKATVLSASGIDAIALLSDGLEPVATDMNSGEPHEPFFEPLLAFAAADRPLERQKDELAQFLSTDRLASRCPDDLSLLLAVRR